MLGELIKFGVPIGHASRADQQTVGYRQEVPPEDRQQGLD